MTRGAITSKLREIMGHWEGMRPMRRLMRARSIEARRLKKLERELYVELGYEDLYDRGLGYEGSEDRDQDFD